MSGGAISRKSEFRGGKFSLRVSSAVQRVVHELQNILSNTENIVICVVFGRESCNPDWGESCEGPPPAAVVAEN
jgi:hypothetical protein